MNELKGKKLLILAGVGTHNKVVKAAREMGIYTIVTDYLVDSPAKQIADEAWMLNITDVENIVKRCKAEHVDGVINFCIDPAQKPYQQICEKLNIPCIGTKESFEILTDKRKFKDYCAGHGVETIPEYTTLDIINENVEYPIFIKPTNSRGSRGQSICFNKSEALDGIKVAKKESSNGGYICEKYMGGKQDIGSAFFVVNGEPYLVKFGDRHLGRIEDNLDKTVICTQLPSTYSEMFEKKVIHNVKNMIRSLGIKFGPVFLQGFIDGDTIYYYDPAQRMPGGDYDLILKEATGFDTVKSCIQFSLTGDTKTVFGNPQNSYRLNDGIALLFTITVRPGRIAKVEGFEQILNHQNVIYGRQIIPEGSMIPNSGDIKQRVAAIGAYITDKSLINNLVKDIYEIYHVYDEYGEDMVISKYEFKVN